MKHRVRSASVAPLLIVVAATCGRDHAAGDAATERVVHRDSAGIAIIESAVPAWRDGGAWQVDTVPEVVIGSNSDVELDVMRGAGAGPEDALLLQRVQAVDVLPDGRIVVADAGPLHVMVFDSLGGLRHRFGGRGGGPGELTGMVDVHVCGGDSIVVAERFQMHVFDDRGASARRVPFRSPGTQRSLEAVSVDCQRLLVRQSVGRPPRESLGTAEDLFAWLDPASESVDTVTTARLGEVWTRVLYGAEQGAVIPWGTSFRTHAVRRDTLVLGYGRVPELRKYDATGRLASMIRWSPEPRPITREDRQRYADVRREWIAGMPPNEPEVQFLFPELDEYPELPSEKPLFDSLLVDDAGGVWARRFPEGSFGQFDGRLRGRQRFGRTWALFDSQTWTVFDSTGAWLGDLTLQDRFDLRAVARGRLYGVATDSLDVETVQVLPLRRSPGARP